jgi:Dolichyl-phosphate-mannose-protein mannosyltransferase
VTVPAPPWPPSAPWSPAPPPSPAAASPPAEPAALAEPGAALADVTVTTRAIARPAAGVADDRLLPHLRWPLLIAILTVQAVLSLHLTWNNTAYIDEATYLWAGHLEIAGFLHGAAVPPFQSWFSGAPVIYPPVGAAADSIGGLAGARLLSLAFMCGATVLLWSTTSRLFGVRAAVFAAGLFAVLGPTQFLGALATYDAMALFLMAASVWCVVAAQDHRDSTLLLLAGIIVLALANATKYATVLFDPVVVVLAALVVAEKRGRKPALGRGGYFAVAVVAIVAALVGLGGPEYVTGLLYTTLARANGDDSPLLVLADAFKWAGAVGVLAWMGVAISGRRGTRAQTIVLAVLAAAWLLAPLNQARIETITSLHKHVDFGAWLAAPAAGYALAQLSRAIRRPGLSLAAAGLIAGLALPPLAVLGWAQASSLDRSWPGSARLITTLRSLTQADPGHYLAEDYDVPGYYLRDTVTYQRWSNTWYFSYTPPGGSRLTGDAAFQAAIRAHYFRLIVLDNDATPETDQAIAIDIGRAGGYHETVVPASVGQYTIWAYQPPQGSGHQRGHG